jgi:hypothetical protein
LILRFGAKGDFAVIATLLLAGSLLVGQTGEAAKDELAQQVKRLIRQLNAPEISMREDAQEQLVKLGPAVLDLLPEPTERTSAEEKQRLAQIRNKLQRAQAEASVQATHVTLTGEMLLSEALAAIQQQTGNVMIDHREKFGQQGGDPKIKLELDNVPFWRAIDVVADKAGLTVYPYAEQDGVAFVSLQDNEVPRLKRNATYAGAFRLEALELLAKRNLKMTTDQRLQVLVELAWEPRLDPITIQQDLAEIKAVDEQGNSLPLAVEEGLREASITPGELATELSLPFELPDRSVKKIGSIKGKLLALVPSRVETFRFADLSGRSSELRKAGVVVVLDQVRKNNDVWEIRVLVRFDKASGALESHRGWIFNNEAYLESADGQRVNFDGFETTRQTDDEVGVGYVFDLERGPKGMTFVYKTPSVISVLPIEYEIKDLPLP